MMVLARPLAAPVRPPAALAVVTAAGVAGAVATGHSLLAVAGSALALVGLVALMWPQVPVLAVVLLLYTNAVGVAVTQYGLPKAVGVLFPAALLLPLAHHILVRRARFVIGPAAGWMLVFLAVQVASALLSQDRSWSMTAVGTYATEGLVLYLMVVNAVRTFPVLRAAVWILLVAGAILGVLALHQQVTGNFGSDYGGFAQVSDASFVTESGAVRAAEQPRLAGAIGQQNYHAQIMLMLVPLGFLLAWHSRSKASTVGAAGLTALVLVGTGLTFSRGAAVGLAIVLLAAAAFGYLRARQLVLLVVAAVLVVRMFPQYGERLTSVAELPALVTASAGAPGLEAADNSTQSRTTEMSAAAHVFFDYPLLGVGPAMFRFYYDSYSDGVGLRAKGTERVAHNLYLEIAANTGILGLGAFLAAIGVTLVSLARVRKRFRAQRPELAGMATAFLLAIVSYLATGLFLSPAFARYFWLVLALAWAMCSIAAETAAADPNGAPPVRPLARA